MAPVSSININENNFSGTPAAQLFITSSVATPTDTIEIARNQLKVNGTAGIFSWGMYLLGVRNLTVSTNQFTGTRVTDNLGIELASAVTNAIIEQNNFTNFGEAGVGIDAGITGNVLSS